MHIVNPTIIMAAGKGSRMRASASVSAEILMEAQSRPKAMIRIGQGGRPLLEHLLLQLREEGCTAACVVIAADDQLTPSHFSAHPIPGLALDFIRQSIPAGRTKPEGTAQAVQLALEAMKAWQGHPITVANGDNLPPRGMFRELFKHDCALPAFQPDRLGLPPDRILAFAVLQANPSGQLSGIIEKPSPEEVSASVWPDGRPRVSMNYFRAPHGDFLEAVRNTPEHPVRLERELPMAVSMGIKSGHWTMRAIPMAGAFLDLTRPEDIVEAGKALDGGGFALEQ